MVTFEDKCHHLTVVIQNKHVVILNFGSALFGFPFPIK